MLLLTRKFDESIIIDDDIIITVVRLRGNQVKIGITAPETVKIYRKEIWDKIQKEKNLENK